MSVGGDLSLDQFAANLQSFERHKPQLMRAIGNAAVGLTREGFRDKRSPDGAPWDDGPCYNGLARSGKMKNSLRVSDSSAHDVTIAFGVFYSAVHQNGATIEAKNAKMLKFQCGGKWVQKKSVEIPARPMLPAGPLPMDWIAEFDEITEDFIDRAFGL